MRQAQQGDTVRVHYTGRLTDGEVFDSSRGGEPIEFILGEGKIIQGFERAVSGLRAGETATVTIPCTEAYGPSDPGLVLEIDRAGLPDDLAPEVGMQLAVSGPDGEPLPVVVTHLCDEHMTLDGNHPLAGLDLVFDIELVEIVSKIIL